MCLAACSFDVSGPSFADAGNTMVDAAAGDANTVIDGGGGADTRTGIDGSPDATGQVCDPGGNDDSCSDSTTLQACRSDGSGFDQSACDLPCVSAPTAHCGGLAPSNGITDAMLDEGSATLDTATTGSLIFNTNNGQIRSVIGGTIIRPAGTGLDAGTGIAFEIINQSGDPADIGVFKMASLNVAEATTIRGVGNNALAIVAAGSMQIDGVILVTGGDQACTPSAVTATLAICAGPGGVAGGAADTAAAGIGGGHQGTTSSGEAESGGGGGGHAGMGGRGGDALTAGGSSGGTGGGIYANAALTPLTGGGGGGGGATELSMGGGPGAVGGGGGGALQLVSRASISFGPNLSGPCGINAGGGGGGGSGNSSAGGGGGAGGGVILEAPSVVFNGQCTLAANGGAGSGGDVGGTATTGQLSDQPAPGGGSGIGSGSGNGGNGSAGATATGSSGVAADREAGGGGGGIGIIRVNTINNTGFTNDGTASPATNTGPLAIQ